MQQLIDIIHKDSNTYFKLYNNIYSDYEIKTGDYINVNILPIKKCVGTIDLVTNRYSPCPYNSNVNKYNTCYSCSKANDFFKCLICHGDSCKNDNHNSRNYCNDIHYVYLAIYDQNKIKVGTCHEKRKKERLIEQGIIAALYVSKQKSGKMARFVESKIHNEFNIPYQINNTYKINNITEISDYNTSYYKLKEMYKLLIEQLSEYINYNEFLFLNNVYDSVLKLKNLSEKYSINLSNNYDKIEGQIVAIRGNLIAVKKEKNIDIINVQKYIGHFIEREEL